MSIPYFYIPSLNSSENTIQLDEETSKHISGVLRMKKGELLQLTDGKGHLAMAEIVDDHRKKCVVRIQAISEQQSGIKKVTIAISLLKNSSRFEWFLEKATEIGISEIIPLLCERTEKEKIRIARMQNILVSAMLQSQQRFLPILYEPDSFHSVISNATQNKKFIAHCINDEKKNLTDLLNESMSSAIILIGPSGDFTHAEVQHAIQNHFVPVSLGRTRLRTETAGIVAATLLSA